MRTSKQFSEWLATRELNEVISRQSIPELPEIDKLKQEIDEGDMVKMGSETKNQKIGIVKEKVGDFLFIQQLDTNKMQKVHLGNIVPLIEDPVTKRQRTYKDRPVWLKLTQRQKERLESSTRTSQKELEQRRAKVPEKLGLSLKDPAQEDAELKAMQQRWASMTSAQPTSQPDIPDILAGMKPTPKELPKSPLYSKVKRVTSNPQA